MKNLFSISALFIFTMNQGIFADNLKVIDKDLSTPDKLGQFIDSSGVNGTAPVIRDFGETREPGFLFKLSKLTISESKNFESSIRKPKELLDENLAPGYKKIPSVPKEYQGELLAVYIRCAGFSGKDFPNGVLIASLHDSTIINPTSTDSIKIKNVFWGYIVDSKGNSEVEWSLALVTKECVFFLTKNSNPMNPARLLLNVKWFNVHFDDDVYKLK